MNKGKWIRGFIMGMAVVAALGQVPLTTFGSAYTNAWAVASTGSDMGLQPNSLPGIMGLQPYPPLINTDPQVNPPPSNKGLPLDPLLTHTAPLPQPSLSDRVVDYRIDVAYDPTERTLDGKETLHWRNPGTLPVDELYFHLYPNAFDSSNSTFMKEQREQNGDNPTVHGDMRLSSLKIAGDGSPDLLVAARFVQPDDGNPDDHTLLKVPLPTPVPSGHDITVQLQFRVDLPDIYRRMGATPATAKAASGEFMMAGQWFPKLAVYEPQGVRGRTDEGWNLHQYHANSEFYADFGTYDVTMRVPLRFQVAASGTLREASTVGNARLYRFTGEDIHDFAWAASSTFSYHEQTVTPHPGMTSIIIELFTDPIASSYRDRYLAAAQKALADYTDWFGPYPYPTLTIVVPPAAAAKAGSMEYPTLVTAKAVQPGETPDLSLERVIMHELAHQYFYGLLANNEFEEAWLDEAFAVYAEDRAMKQEYGQARGRLPIGRVKQVVRSSWLYPTRFDYEDNVYFRGQMVLDSLSFRLGQAAMDRILREYVEQYRFHHPSTNDFIRLVEEKAGSSAGNLLRDLLFGPTASNVHNLDTIF